MMWLLGTCKQILKVSDFYLDKQKKILKEVYHVPWIVLFSADRWPLEVLTFLIHGFAPCNYQNSWANKMKMRLYKKFGLIEHSYTYISSQRIFMWMYVAANVSRRKLSIKWWILVISTPQKFVKNWPSISEFKFSAN